MNVRQCIVIKNFNQNVCTQLPNCADADGDMKRFHKEKSEWGFAKLITLEAFNNSSNGYLVDDCCEFGAEVFVYSRNSKWESLTMVKEPSDGTFRYEMENFSAKTQSSYDSKLSVHSWRTKLVCTCSIFCTSLCKHASEYMLCVI